MNKNILIISVSVLCVLLISFANTQSDERAKFKFAAAEFLYTLPHTHAQVKLSETFLKNWKLTQSTVDSSKSLTFSFIADIASQSLLIVHDFVQKDKEQVKAEVKNIFDDTDLKLVNEREMILNDRNIDFLFFQDTRQNVSAYFIFKIEDNVFAVQLITNFERYSELYNSSYEIFNSIKTVKSAKTGFDKIVIDSNATILVPVEFRYVLPIDTKLFSAESDSLKMQCLTYESSKSARQIANEVEQKLVEKLGFKRSAGKITLIDERDKILFVGQISDDKQLRMYTIKKGKNCYIYVFIFEVYETVESVINQIVDSIEFRTEYTTPDSVLPFALTYDTNSDEKPDYFTINMIFFDASHRVISERFRKGKLTVRITDENNKTAFISEAIDIENPQDCLSKGICAEKLRFDGLWVSKLMSPDYKITINITFNNSKISYEGDLSDLIIR